MIWSVSESGSVPEIWDLSVHCVSVSVHYISAILCHKLLLTYCTNKSSINHMNITLQHWRLIKGMIEMQKHWIHFLARLDLGTGLRYHLGWWGKIQHWASRCLPSEDLQSALKISEKCKIPRWTGNVLGMIGKGHMLFHVVFYF